MQGGSKPFPAAQQRIGGPGSAALKYDILTALLVLSAQGQPLESRLALRLSLLMTARYNWRLATFSVGLRELARLWGVTERTAKREMAAMRACNWIAIAVPAARGRVATYRIDLPTILRATMPFWEAVGPDFLARMSGVPETVPASNVVPLRSPTPALPTEDGTGWAEAAATLRRQDPAIYDAWFAPLTACELDAGVLTLVAPTRFHADYVRTHHKTRLMLALTVANPGIREICVLAADQLSDTGA